MPTTEIFRAIALSFNEVIEQPHFERTAFKVNGKRIFASLLEAEQSANIKLTPADQATFCQYDAEAIYPVPNKWGQQGWTTFELTKVPEELLREALHAAYQDVIQAKKR